MAGLKCLCGASMKNSSRPSENIIHVYSDTEIDEATERDMDIKLWDFYTKERPYEYWCCTHCKRVSVVDEATNKVVCVYAIEKVYSHEDDHKEQP